MTNELESFGSIQESLELDLNNVVAALGPGLVPWNHKGNDPY